MTQITCKEMSAPQTPMTLLAWLDLAMQILSVCFAFWFMGHVTPVLIPSAFLGDGFGVLIGVTTVIGLPVYAVSAYLDTLYHFPRNTWQGIASLVLVIAPILFPAMVFQASLTRSELLLVGGIQLYLVYGCIGLWFTWRHAKTSPVIRLLTGHVPPKICSVMLGISMLCFFLGTIPVVMKGAGDGLVGYVALGAWCVVMMFSIIQRTHRIASRDSFDHLYGK